jgi:anti-sigma28 factor (negative regulator of flagellin synthesis)
MTVDKLSRLFAAFGNSSSTTKPTAEGSDTAQQSAAASQSPEAVRVAQGFGSGSGSTTQSDRAAKVAELKQAVNSGNYKPDTKQVAIAVAQELFF